MTTLVLARRFISQVVHNSIYIMLITTFLKNKGLYNYLIKFLLKSFH